MVSKNLFDYPTVLHGKCDNTIKPGFIGLSSFCMKIGGVAIDSLWKVAGDFMRNIVMRAGG